jgi:hypothetical protein
METWVYCSALTLAFGFGFAIACAVFADKIGGRTPSAAENENNLILDNCKCGRKPCFTRSMENAGMGPRISAWSIECECGMKTVSIDEYSLNENECKIKLVKIWNHNGD